MILLKLYGLMMINNAIFDHLSWAFKGENIRASTHVIFEFGLYPKLIWFEYIVCNSSDGTWWVPSIQNKILAH